MNGLPTDTPKDAKRYMSSLMGQRYTHKNNCGSSLDNISTESGREAFTRRGQCSAVGSGNAIMMQTIAMMLKFES